MRGNKIDANQPEIVEHAKKIGAVWISATGDQKIGFDGLLAYRGQVYVCEIKDGRKPLSARKLTEGEQKRKEQLEACGVPYNVIESIEDMYKLLGVI